VASLAAQFRPRLPHGADAGTSADAGAPHLSAHLRTTERGG